MRSTLDAGGATPEASRRIPATAGGDSRYGLACARPPRALLALVAGRLPALACSLALVLSIFGGPGLVALRASRRALARAEAEG